MGQYLEQWKKRLKMHSLEIVYIWTLNRNRMENCISPISILWKISGKSMDSGKIHSIEFGKSIVWNTLPYYGL